VGLGIYRDLSGAAVDPFIQLATVVVQFGLFDSPIALILVTRILVPF